MSLAEGIHFERRFFHQTFATVSFQEFHTIFNEYSQQQAIKPVDVLCFCCKMIRMESKMVN